MTVPPQTFYIFDDISVYVPILFAYFFSKKKKKREKKEKEKKEKEKKKNAEKGKIQQKF